MDRSGMYYISLIVDEQKMADQKCCLKEYVSCSGSGRGSLVGVERLWTASIGRGDSLFAHISGDSDDKVWCYKNCVSTYTSKKYIQRHI